MNTDGPVRLGPRQRDLVVAYTVASFPGSARPRLRHRLESFDAEWVAASAPGVAHYRALPPGRYTLKLQAGEGPTAALEVIAEPPLWRSRSFLALLLAVAAAAAFALHRARMSRLQLRHRAAADERARIARDLHDGLAQKLTAIGLLADSTRGPVPERQMRHIVDEAQAELRRAIWDMREGTASEPRLERLIEQTVAEVALPPGLAVGVETSPSSLAVGGLALHEVPLIVREALRNAVRHAQARHIEVGVLSDHEGLQVWVRDDGRGFVTDALAPGRGAGFGLVGMHERARRLAGTLTIQSEPGRGTQVSLFVPRDRP